MRFSSRTAAGLLAIVLGAGLAPAFAGHGRLISGGHPYHNGHLFIPPASAYSPVTYRPPTWYGAPAYYYPQSYLAPEGLYTGPTVYPFVATPRSYYNGIYYNGGVSMQGQPYYYP